MKALLLSLVFIPLAGWAQLVPPPVDEVTLQAEASREVQNDQMVAVLGITVQGADPSALAEQVNREMEAALRVAKQVSSIRARSLGYQTTPRYGKEGRIEGWQVSQDLRLESSDFPAATKLVGALQKSLMLRSLQVRLSPESRRAAADALIEEAMRAFQARADLVAKAAKANGYRLGSVQVMPAGGGPVPVMAMARAAPSAQVAVESGTSTVTVGVSGSIRLTR